MRKQTVANAKPALKSIYEGWERTDGSYRPDHGPRRRIRAGTKWKLPKPAAALTQADLEAFRREHEGEFVVLPIERELYGFGRVIRGTRLGFYDLLSPSIPSVDEIERHSILFVVDVLYGPLFTGRWRVIGKKPLPDDLKRPLKFYSHVQGTDFVEIHIAGEARPRSYAGEDLTKMENVNGWWSWSVEERLRSHFAGRPDLQLERLKIPAARAERLRREYFERQKARKGR